MNIQTIKHVSDCVPLYLPQSLYLKPHAKMCISVSLPSATTGKSISSYDAMENLRKMIAPEKFSVLKVSEVIDSTTVEQSAKCKVQTYWIVILICLPFRLSKVR